MESNVYRYLFPFEKIPQGSKILIYGAGVIGQEYLKQILITKYCEVIGFVDRNYKDYRNMIVPVYSSEKIHELEFDFVVIALRDAFGIPDIRQKLSRQGVPDEDIVYVLERADTGRALFATENGASGNLRSQAYLVSSCAFALYLAGGFGDMICQKHFVEALAQLGPEATIDIYAAKDAEYLKWLYSDCSYVNLIALDLGVRYISNQKKYALSISIFGPKFLQVDHFNQGIFSSNTTFVKSMNALQTNVAKEAIHHTVPAAVAYLMRIYRGENCRTWFNYGGALCIKDGIGGIPYIKEYEKNFLALGLKCFITVHAGTGSAKDGKDIAKTWPASRFDETIKMFKKKYPLIQVVQLGEKDGEILQHADVRLIGEEFGLISLVLRKAIFHLDIEGGLVHLASHVGTKCVVLFGPTQVEYFSYRQNINIRKGNCHGCYGLYLNTDCCARGMEKPECMYSITPEIVMEEIDTYMSTLESGVDIEASGGVIRTSLLLNCVK